MKEESPYIRKIRDKLPGPDWRFVHDLELLRAVIRQSERTGNYGPSGSLVNERYIDLKQKHPEAVRAFEAELREEKEWERSYRETKRRETLERHKQSAYLREKMEELSESEDGDRQLRGLMQLRDLMISSKMGYGSQVTGYYKANLRKRYPEAYEAFEEELGLGAVGPLKFS